MQKADTVTPNVIGKSLHDSIEILSEQRLSVRLLAQREDQGLPEGFVLDQFPRAMQKIRPNQTIFITLSTKQRIALMPDFAGKSYKDAMDMAEQKGLETKIYRLNAPYEKSTCIAQLPAVDENLTSKRVILYISDGTPTLAVMPSLIGQQLGSVENILKKHDVRAQLFHVQEQAADHLCQSCLIVDQQPVAGSIIDLSGALHVQFRLQAQ